MIVLDTNVVSALMTSRADALDGWIAEVDGASLFTTAITRAEIRYGIARLPEGARRTELASRADALFEETADRILPFDSRAADRYGVLVADRERAGRPISVPDAQVAAIALVHRAIVATRNTRDFSGTGVRLVNPFPRDTPPADGAAE